MDRTHLLHRFSLVVLLGLSAVPGCGKGLNVTPLDPNIRNQIQQNFDNGGRPRPGDIANGTIPSLDQQCSNFRASLPKDWFQDLLEVPEDPAHPDGRKIHVFYYGKLNPPNTPVVFFNGGPGGDSHGSYQAIRAKKYLNDPEGKIPFVYIDQRGNGCSDFYPQMKNNSAPDAETLLRLRSYGSRGIVSDAELIRKKLIGDQPWIAFGQSYGAYIVHRYATLAPKSLKAGFAHANAITSDGYHRIKGRIFSQARVQTIYLAQYPDDQALLQTLNDKLTPDHCYQDEATGQRACGHEVLDSLAGNFIGFNDHWPVLHEWINVMAQNQNLREEGIQLYLKTYYFNPGNPLNSQRWMDKVVSWVDRNVAPMDRFHCLQIKKDLLAEQQINLDQIYLHECQSSLQENFSAVDTSLPVQNLTKDTLLLSDFVQSLTANPSLSFFWYSGTKDTYVPLENYQDEIKATENLPNMHYLNFTGTGHDGFLSEPKVWIDLIDQVKR